PTISELRLRGGSRAKTSLRDPLHPAPSSLSHSTHCVSPLSGLASSTIVCLTLSGRNFRRRLWCEVRAALHLVSSWSPWRRLAIGVLTTSRAGARSRWDLAICRSLFAVSLLCSAPSS